MDEQQPPTTSTMPQPIGFFWDLENCQIPASKSSLDMVQAIRAKFSHIGSEMEFTVVCDVTKEPPSVINGFNSAQVLHLYVSQYAFVVFVLLHTFVQVNVIHVASTSKNAADEKLKSCLRKFSFLHKRPCTVVLVSGSVLIFISALHYTIIVRNVRMFR